MKRFIVIQKEYDQVGTIEDLTSVFEAIASTHIAQIKDRVLASTSFFNELWQIYAQLRRDPSEHIGKQAKSGRGVVIAITSEGGLIGDIDEKIIQATLASPEMANSDLFVIGAHGQTLLRQRNLQPTKAFGLPNVESGASATELIHAMIPYGQATVFYQTYVSLTRQEVSRIDLFSAVRELSEKTVVVSSEMITSRNYLFEPSLEEIVAYMESFMLQVALGQVMLASKLAQYASRFNAMSTAKSKARDLQRDLGLELSRSKRVESDERIKEILSALKQTRAR